MAVENQITAIREISATTDLGVSMEGAILRYFKTNERWQATIITHPEYAMVFPRATPGSSRKLHGRWIQGIPPGLSESAVPFF